MFTKNKLFSILSLFLILVFSFLINTNNAFASITNGTIDSTYHYAWGENVGWVDFANVTISDTALSGYIYGENIGWIDLSTVTNTNAGGFSGYAWGENVGWVDFSGVSIGTDGVFVGSAYGENIGWISFGTGDNKVLTDWRPQSARPTYNSGGGGVSSRTQQVATRSAVVCKEGEKFNTVNGLPCTSFVPSTPIVSTGGSSSCLITLTLKQGSKGEEVKCLQTKLNTPADGNFGKKTKQAVVVFQKNHKLKADGVVGPTTRKVLNGN